MADIEVQGIGTLSFPEGMAPEDIEKAIKEHPNYNKVARESRLSKTFGAINDITPDWLKGPDPLNPSGFGTSAVKGIPVLGALAPDTEAQVKYEQEHPIASKMGELTGNIVSTLPLAGGVAANSARGLIPQIFGQGMLGGTLRTGDTLARQGSEAAEQIPSEFGKGFGWGSLGPILGKMITPGTRPIPKGPDPTATSFESIKEAMRANVPPRMGGEMAKNTQLKDLLTKYYVQKHMDKVAQTEDKLHLTREAFKDSPWSAFGRGAAAAILPTSFHAHPAISGAAAATAMAAPHLPYLGSRYIHNTLMNNPGTEAILNALMQSKNIGQ
jgi:hypothetical protein